MKRVIMKFGGTSVGSAERISGIVQIIKKYQNGEFDRFPEKADVVLVVSAFSGVTDSLLRAANAAAIRDHQVYESVAVELREKHFKAVDALARAGEIRSTIRSSIEAMVSDFENLCRAISILGELTPRGKDEVASLGERLCAPVVAGALLDNGIKSQIVESTALIVTDSLYGSATPQMDLTKQKSQGVLLPLLASGITPVVTGFIGATPDGVLTTLGRGGSDFSAAILGSCLDCEEIWIWTDVNGVMTADPRVVPSARTIPQVSFSEAAEMSYFGAKVLHPKTMLPAMERNIPIRILNSFEPDNPGTIVTNEVTGSTTPKAITAIQNLGLVTVEGHGMTGVPGMAAKVFLAVAQENISVLMISQSSSEQNICFVINQEDSSRALTALEKAFQLELAQRNIDRIWAQTPVGIVAVVGAGMRGIPGISAQVFGALGEKRINVISIAQGSSEYNISLVVDQENITEAVSSIHAKFGL